MSGIADSAPAAGGFLLSVLYALGYIVIWYSKRLRKRSEKAMSQVPPSPQFQPPESDPHALKRLDAMEHESALSVALVRERGVVDELRRELAETRAERDQLVVELRASRALVERLRAEIRARRSRGAVEVSAAAYRDASQPGELQDAIKTPLRPPRG